MINSFLLKRKLKSDNCSKEGIHMRKSGIRSLGRATVFLLTLSVFMLFGIFQWNAEAFTLKVVDQAGNPVQGFRWMVEEDTTNVVTPGTFSARTLGVDIHTTYAPGKAK